MGKSVLKYYVNTLYPGDCFRDWLAGLLGERIQNKNCEVDVFKYDPSSHTYADHAHPRGMERSHIN
ncbi:hypothetical protein HNV12_24235 [Methanococcoides sp. SA1]|nr:hypothetical protein [Methanococcoides sp. SA1]